AVATSSTSSHSSPSHSVRAHRARTVIALHHGRLGSQRCTAFRSFFVSVSPGDGYLERAVLQPSDSLHGPIIEHSCCDLFSWLQRECWPRKVEALVVRKEQGNLLAHGNPGPGLA